MTNDEVLALKPGDRVLWDGRDTGDSKGTVLELGYGLLKIRWDNGVTGQTRTDNAGNISREALPMTDSKTARLDEAAGVMHNKEWYACERAHVIQRMEAVLRNPVATVEEKKIAQDMLTGMVVA